MEIKFDQEFDICMLELNSLSALKNVIFLATSALKLGEVTVQYILQIIWALLRDVLLEKNAFFLALPELPLSNLYNQGRSKYGPFGAFVGHILTFRGPSYQLGRIF